MRPFVRLSLVLAVLGLGRCGASDQGHDAPEASVDTIAEAKPDSPAPEAAEDTVTPDPADEAGADVPASDTPPDAPAPDHDETDAPSPTVIAAVPGARCAPATRIGRVMVYGSDFATTLDAAVEVNDRAPTWLLGPKLTDASCSFFEQLPPAFCGTCPDGTICTPDGSCQTLPVPVPDVVLTLMTADASQVFATTGALGGAWGAVTLPGRAFAVEVSWGDLTVTLGPTAVPDVLEGATQTLAGSYDEPTALDLTWTPPQDGATVFTHIPINHHAAGATYTECAVEAAVGALHVDGAMLVPLAVETGLEFQGIEHVRFAAAETPAGCVDVLFQVHQYVN